MYGDATPLFDLDGLRRSLERFAGTLEERRQDLISLGCPMMSIMGKTKLTLGLPIVRTNNHWLEVSLGNLYYTEMDARPLLHFELDVPDEAKENIWSIRPKLHSLKVDVLHKLVEAIHRRASSSVWEDCISMISGKITGDEARFLLETETRYPTLYPYPNMISFLNPGGLGDLLYVIGHVEKELTIATHARTCQAATPLFEQGSPSISDTVVGKRGRARHFADEGEKARKMVGTAIGRALTEIGKHNPALFKHLDNSLHDRSGFNPVYRPETPTKWVFR